MKKLILLISILVYINANGQKKIKFDDDFRFADNSGCNYALVFYNDSGLRLNFYNCFGKIKFVRNYSNKYKPKKMDAKGKYINGIETEYNEAGQIIRESQYFYGSKNGFTREFNDHGILISACTYFNGIKNGEEYIYFENGQLRFKRYYSYGQLHGTEFHYDEYGKVKRTKEYEFGNCMNGYQIKTYQNKYKNIQFYDDGHLLKAIVLHPNLDTSSIYHYKLENGQSYLYNCTYYTNNKVDTNFTPRTAKTILNRELNPIKDTFHYDTIQYIDAKFFGGDSAFYAMLNENLVYPNEMKSNEISEVAVVVFTLSREGIILDIGSNSKVNQDFTIEAIRVLKLSSGRWFPAKQYGQETISNFRIGITFMLESY